MCCPFRCGWPGLTSALFEFLGRLLDHAALVTKKKRKGKGRKRKKGRKKKKFLIVVKLSLKCQIIMKFSLKMLYYSVIYTIIQHL